MLGEPVEAGPGQFADASGGVADARGKFDRLQTQGVALVDDLAAPRRELVEAAVEVATQRHVVLVGVREPQRELVLELVDHAGPLGPPIAENLTANGADQPRERVLDLLAPLESEEGLVEEVLGVVVGELRLAQDRRELRTNLVPKPTDVEPVGTRVGRGMQGMGHRPPPAEGNIGVPRNDDRPSVNAAGEVWFDAAARTANAYRILGLYPECRRNLARLATIEEFVGSTSATAAMVRAIQERGARRLSFLATLEWTQGSYASALSRVNWEVAKRRLLVDPQPLAIAYSVRCAIRLDAALDLAGGERTTTVEAARRDALRCVEHSADPAVSAAPLASLALWVARDGGEIEPYSRHLEAWTNRGLTIPEAIALRFPWARALLAAGDSVPKADALVAHCYQRFCALGRVTDAGLVALDRIRIRLESGIPLGIVQLVLEAKTRLNQASQTPETVRVLDALWLRVLQAARPSGARPDLGAELHAAHVALARE